MATEIKKVLGKELYKISVLSNVGALCILQGLF